METDQLNGLENVLKSEVAFGVRHDMNFTQTDERIKALFVFLSIGNVQERVKIIEDNLKVLGTSANLGRYRVVSNEPKWLHDMEKDPKARCTIVRIYGGRYSLFLKTLMPSLLREAGYNYLTISLDDVSLVPPYGNYNVTEIFDFMEHYKLHVSSPAINNTSHARLFPTTLAPMQIGRLVKMIEFQTISFRTDAWACQYELIDLKYPGGWGLDVWFYDYCILSGRLREGRMGLLDTMQVYHNPHGLESTNTKEASRFMDKQERAWNEEKGIRLVQQRAATISNIFLFEE
eukprot:CAMPEP_0176505298 /NCGR_PEP_ID=MMETSP0200_2-20121128/16418_1 /TAXON_ID=947934 /ORGANISM="Chaetoceros sp., Strain GSL56" /LENGTH=288 /DNA_ID=CAMNT_0017904839 /DNA_START=126 /DNA_END=992 /DNA_ORIENTATION=-